MPNLPPHYYVVVTEKLSTGSPKPEKWAVFATRCVATRRLCRAAALFGSAQLSGELAIRAVAQRAIIVGAGGIVGMADQIGDRRVAQHSPAVGQHRAGKAQHLPVGEVDIDRRLIARSHHRRAPRD